MIYNIYIYQVYILSVFFGKGSKKLNSSRLKNIDSNFSHDFFFFFKQFKHNF